MNEQSTWLHNMSAPPKSVVKYSGLSDLFTKNGPGGTGICTLKFAGAMATGRAIRFSLPEKLRGASVEEILRFLDAKNMSRTPDSALKHLQALVNDRARELPLPPGCAVVRTSPDHPSVWPDPLSALAVLSKSTDTVWLRDKTPALSLAVQRTAISLLVPAAFSDQLKETV
jgi:hypothetical protein